MASPMLVTPLITGYSESLGATAIGVSLYERVGYKTAFLVATICTVLTILSIQFVNDKGEPILSVQDKNVCIHRKLEIVDRNVIPVAIIIMLFAIPYCATQSFLVNYVEKRQLSVTVSLFFPLYAAIILVLRLSLKNLLDTPES